MRSSAHLRPLLRHLFCILVIATLALPGCATRFNANVDYDHEYDFASVRKLGFEPETGEKLVNAPKEMRELRAMARSAIRQELAAKGIEVVPPEEADLLIRFAMGRRGKRRTSGMSEWGEEAGIVLALVDPATGREPWHAWSTATWHEGMQAEEEVPKAVKVLLEQYPPSR